MDDSSSLESTAPFTTRIEVKGEQAANQLDEILEPNNNLTQECKEEGESSESELAEENPATNTAIQQHNQTVIPPTNFRQNDAAANCSLIVNLLLSHYSQLVDHFQPSVQQLTTLHPPTPATPLNASTLVVISTPEQLAKLLVELHGCREIAVHLFYEDGYSMELVTVMALSTKTHDFLLDVERLDSAIAHLSEIFLNPNIVKVVFQSERFLDSLKYSMHILCVNVFDVQDASIAGGASRLLFLERLTEVYGINRLPAHMPANHLYRLSPVQLDRYRCFSHYLIFFYEECKWSLNAISPFLLKTISDKCNTQCKQLIRADAKPSCYNTYLRFLKAKQQCELELFERTFAWRENAAGCTKVNRSRVLRGPELVAIVCNLPQNRAELAMVAPEFAACQTSATHYLETVLQAGDMKRNIACYREKVPINLAFMGDRMRSLREDQCGTQKNKDRHKKDDNDVNLTKVNPSQSNEPRDNPEVHTEPSASSDSMQMNSATNGVQNESHNGNDSTDNLVPNEAHKMNGSAGNTLLQRIEPKRQRRRLQYNATNGNGSE